MSGDAQLRDLTPLSSEEVTAVTNPGRIDIVAAPTGFTVEAMTADRYTAEG